MSSSKTSPLRQPVGGEPPASPAPAGAPSPYARFIPSEELGPVAAWSPHTFGETRPGPPEALRDPPPAAPPMPPGVSISKGRPGHGKAAAPDPTAMKAARDAGYQDGYRDGLAALEQYKRTFATQAGAQVSALASEFHQRLETLEQQLAGRLAGVALDLARQIVRSEITQRPELVVQVAEEALLTLLTTAKQISVRVHPDDLSLVAHSLSETLKARGAQLIADPRVSRGGCLVDSDIAAVDASIQSRWQRASRVFGSYEPWVDDPPPAFGASRARAAMRDEAGGPPAAGGAEPPAVGDGEGGGE